MLEALRRKQCSGGAMVLGKLPVSGRSTIWMIVGQGPTALEVGAGEGSFCLFSPPPRPPPHARLEDGPIWTVSKGR